MARLAWFPLLLAFWGCSEPPSSDKPRGSNVLVPALAGQPSILVFTRTAGFRHDSIPAGVTALTELAREHGFGLSETEDPEQFGAATLAPFAAVVFLSTTGDVLDATQQTAFEQYLAGGRGFVGVHAATDCEYDWPYYGELVGAYFGGHSDVLDANVELEPITHPALTGLTSPWQHQDEWYAFRTNPRAQTTVLLTVDEASYDPGQGEMGADHPVAWFHSYRGARAFYTALGHTRASFSEAPFRAHLLGGLQWAAGITP